MDASIPRVNERPTERVLPPRAPHQSRVKFVLLGKTKNQTTDLRECSTVVGKTNLCSNANLRHIRELQR
eukprot:5450423-Pyramimonas_sp.AAC.1